MSEAFSSQGSSFLPLFLLFRSHQRHLIASPSVSVSSIMSLFSCWMCAKDQKFRDSDAVNQTIQMSMQPRSQIFSFKELRKATSSFKDKLGEGGFGPVYKGSLRDGTNIAVKKLSHRSNLGEEDAFLYEVTALTAVEHQNVIRLLGGCIHKTERMLVYEYMPNGSLDKYLFESTAELDLDWHARRNIIVGTANGLYYLHEGLPEKMINRDIKASNILLDENMNPKISDFCLAKLLNLDETHNSFTRVAGTIGYIAPEYYKHGMLTDKADVYSFGVLVLEIVTGKKYFNTFSDERTLLDLAWKFYEERCLLDLVDARIRDTALPAEDVIRVMHIALLCTQEKAELRPDMLRVLSLLREQSKILEKPTKPPYVGLFNEEEEDEDMFCTAVEDF